MKKLILVGVLGAAAAAVGMPTAHVSAQSANANTTLATVRIARKVTAGGSALDPGTYQLRLTGEHPQPAAGASPDAEEFVEFVKSGKVVAREVATVVSKDDIKEVAKGETPPAPGTAKVELLKGNDYLRIWANKGGTNYLVHLPTGA
jgi:hypothetical protein